MLFVFWREEIWVSQAGQKVWSQSANFCKPCIWRRPVVWHLQPGHDSTQKVNNFVGRHPLNGNPQCDGIEAIDNGRRRTVCFERFAVRLNPLKSVIRELRGC